MRKIRLQNASGAWLDLTSAPAEFFLHDLTGFGFETESEFQRIGEQYLLIDRVHTQWTPGGILSVGGYANYLRFAKFIQDAPLTLEYSAEGTYSVQCYVKSIEKSEITEGGRLECPITFECIGRIAKKVFYRADYDGLSGKGYPYSYPFRYDSGATGKFEIESDSMIESPVTITFIGPVLNPTWVHYRNSKACCSGRVNCSIPEGHRLVISNVGKYVIKETDNLGNLIADRYQDSDFSTRRFVELGHGMNVINFTHDGPNNVNIIVEGQIFYETV